MSTSLRAVVVLALSASSVTAKASPEHCAADPFVDPATDICNPLRYIPSNTLTAVAFALYMTCAFIMTYLIWRRGARWMAAMVIGSYTFSIGLAFRFALHTNPQAKIVYIIEYLFTVLTPCAFIAAVYVLLGRLARYLDMSDHLLVSPRHITKIFVASDVTTFLIQSVGGSVSIAGSTSGNVKVKNVGTHITLVGLALQLASFFFFTVVYLIFLYRVRRHAPEVWSPSPKPTVWGKRWHILASAIGISCVGILIRSAYRTVELSQGYTGHLATTEGFFYGLDCFPLLLAIGVYIPLWPGRFIDGDKDISKNDQRETGSDPEKDNVY